MMKHEGLKEDQIDLGRKILTSVLAFGQAMVIVEFVCYLFLFQSLLEHNKSLFKMVQEDILKKRAKKNTITFTGQVITFAIEVLYTILMQVLINFGTIGGFFEAGAIPCALLLPMAAVTVTQIMTSPELRRFYVG